MPDNRYYRVVIASTQGGLAVAAGDWTILATTIRKFEGLDANDDQSLGDIGRILVTGQGWVALAYKNVTP